MYIAINDKTKNVVGKFEERPLSISEGFTIIEVTDCPEQPWRYKYIGNTYVKRQDIPEIPQVESDKGIEVIGYGR